MQSASPPDYSQEAYVVEHSSQKMRYENDGTGVLENEAQIKIISESGVQAPPSAPSGLQAAPLGQAPVTGGWQLPSPQTDALKDAAPTQLGVPQEVLEVG